MSALPRRLALSVLPESFAIVRLPANASLPPWAVRGAFFSVTRTADELSIVCAAESVPETFAGPLRWRAFKAHGPFALSDIGVLAALTAPLAEAKISIFAISSYDTDYLLVNAAQMPNAIDALQRSGHIICEAASPS
jgi:uncharacterized protein